MFLIPRTFLAAIILVMSSGAVVLAAPADQSATATPVPTPSCVTPPSGIVLDVSNPNPGASLSPGSNVVITGTAFDVNSTSGSGISSVTAYLGSRDAGGIFLGQAVLGQSTGAAQGTPLATAGFTIRSITLPAGSGSRSIFVYALSSISNKQATVEIPIFLGPPPTAVKGVVPTAVLPPPPACTPTPTPVPTATSTPAPVVLPAAATATPLPAAAAAPTVAALPTLAPLPTQPAAPAAVVAPAAAAPSPAPVTAVAPVAAIAPRGGGIPAELGLPLLAVGSIVLAGGYALRRRKK